jgi:Mn2+/Fe2+ NRAMP family transporter
MDLVEKEKLVIVVKRNSLERYVIVIVVVVVACVVTLMHLFHQSKEKLEKNEFIPPI